MSNEVSSRKTTLPTELMFGGVEARVSGSYGDKKPEAALLCVPQLVARQAAENPDAIALQSASQVLTYGDLNCQANQLANHLKAMGVGPEKLVGVCLERSPQMVMAALAILKTGGAYLPLDPTFPTERLDSILQDADACVLITRSGLPCTLAEGNWRVVDIDLDRSEIAAHPTEPPVVELRSDHLAYVIFTSGSTGRPKGVEITHRGLCNLISWHWRAFQVTVTDRASHQAALGFDAAVWEIWPYLTIGASVHMPEEAVRNNPEALCRWLVERKITITFVATALAERMMFLEWPPETALRILLTGADTLRHRPPAKLPFTLVNNYGPTECTVVATSAPVAPREYETGMPSIGRAIDNTELYILDEQMKPVQSGTAGELYIGGAGVARGYRNRAELTEQSFVANPFTSDVARLYRTGDLVRSLPDGEIEFLGRLDEQIKIRGYRIEPGDIVSALNSHRDVQSSVVIAREDEAGEKRLVAYVILNGVQQPPTAGAMREHLRKELPDYMVPASFVQLSSLPLTANGKTDKSALPVPTGGNSLPDAEFIAPRGIVEERLAAVIGSLLNVDRVGVNDNFFLLGGHSLLGTQLLTRVSQNFGVELSLLNLFDHPTLAEMSDQIEKLILEKIVSITEAPQRFVPPLWMEGNPR
jgi:amino acid adenylation domain-containing protein